MSRNSKPKKLTIKVIIPLFLTVVLSLAIIFLILARQINEETAHHKNAYLELKTRNLFYFCENNFGKLAVLENFGSEETATALKDLTISEIEGASLSEGLEVLVINAETVLFSTLDIRKAPYLKGESGTVEIETPKGVFRGYYHYFSPWKWYLVTLMPEHKYLTVRKSSYEYIALTLIICMFLIAGVFYILRTGLQVPIANILSDLRHYSRISYRSGTEELDLLSDRINSTFVELGKLKNAIDQASEAVVITDARGIIEYVNPAFERITGYTEEEALGQNPRFLKSGIQTKEFHEVLWATILRGDTWQGTLTNKKKSGEIYREEMTITPVKDIAGTITHFVAIKKDITERERLQNQLLHAQKMQSIGVLAEGIAHEFKNDLTVMLSFSEIILQDPTINPEVANYIGIIKHTAQKSSHTVKQLLSFARKDDFKPVRIDINTLVSENCTMFSKLLPKNITFKTALSESLPPILADTAKIEQVLMNLVINAKDAMPDGGEIILKADLKELVTGDLDLPTIIKAGQYLHLTVSDTGTGIPGEHLDHIFKPFYTTKERGKGTGLGLAIVYGIIKDHKGYITVENNTNRGTTFNIYLPASQNAS